MPRLIVGCPVFQRSWILPNWLEYIENQTFPLSDIGFVFELGPDDSETHQILFDWHANHPEVGVFDMNINHDEKHSHHTEGMRTWNFHKYYSMIEFRNNLLERVRCLAPEKYFSLDSDILLIDKETIQNLWDLTEKDDIDAIAPLMYMTPIDDRYPSVMSWLGDPGFRARRLHERYEIGELFQADIIMAAKMMSKPVYENVNYRFHKQGEDLGWSAECTRHGYSLWSASYIYAPHIMSIGQLNSYLNRGDDRFP